MMPWPLNYWRSGEWQVVQERLTTLAKAGRQHCPARGSLFTALRRTKMDDIKVAIIGQDPYPNPVYATGVAFEVPKVLTPDEFPQTLREIFSEYSRDLRYPLPEYGDLSPWSEQGVLLWNAYPTCEVGKSLSHMWPEWALLTREILTNLSNRGVVIAFLGGVARTFNDDHIHPDTDVIETSHPSPRGSLNSKTPFRGCRLFSTINSYLTEPIDWKLPSTVSSPDGVAIHAKCSNELSVPLSKDKTWEASKET